MVERKKIMRTIIKKLFIHFDEGVPTIEVEDSVSLGGINGTDSFTGFDTRIYVDKIDLLDVYAMPSLDDLDI